MEATGAREPPQAATAGAPDEAWPLTADVAVGGEQEDGFKEEEEEEEEEEEKPPADLLERLRSQTGMPELKQAVVEAGAFPVSPAPAAALAPACVPQARHSRSGRSVVAAGAEA